jgi:hypothetical protein
VLVSALLLVPGVLHAQSLDEADRIAVAAVVAKMDLAVREQDVMAAMELAPPKVLDGFARSVGLSREEMLALMEDVVPAAMARLEIVVSRSHPEDWQPGESPTGRPYLVIPNEVTMRFDGRLSHADTYTLALKDEGDWYLMSTANSDHMEILKRVYPDLRAIEVPRGEGGVLQ